MTRKTRVIKLIKNIFGNKPSPKQKKSQDKVRVYVETSTEGKDYFFKDLAEGARFFKRMETDYQKGNGDIYKVRPSNSVYNKYNKMVKSGEIKPIRDE